MNCDGGGRKRGLRIAFATLSKSTSRQALSRSSKSRIAARAFMNASLIAYPKSHPAGIGGREAENGGHLYVCGDKFMLANERALGLEIGAADHLQLTALFEPRDAGLNEIEAPHSEISPHPPETVGVGLDVVIKGSGQRRVGRHRYDAALALLICIASSLSDLRFSQRATY